MSLDANLDLKNLDVEKRKELNRGFYNELARRYGVIKQLFPDIQKAPESIQNEYFSAGRLMHYLLDGVSSHIHGPKIVEGNYVIDAFLESKYYAELEEYKKYHEENKQYITQQQEASFQFAKPDYDQRLQMCENAATEEELGELMRSFYATSEVVDFDSVFAARAVASKINKMYPELLAKISDAEKIKAEEMKRRAHEAAEKEWEQSNGFYKFFAKLTGRKAKIINDNANSILYNMQNENKNENGISR